MTPFSRRPLAAALLLFLIVFAAVSWLLLRTTQDQLVYALDDAYIHMAMAHTLAEHGVWGINATGFASASSSPLWTASLALVYRVVGTRDAVPLVLNLVAVPLSLAVVTAILQERQVPPARASAVACATVLCTPMAPLVWIGMEHSLNNLFVLLTLWGTVRLTAADAQRTLVWFFASVLLACATRFEGVFVAGGCVCALLLSRRYRAALVGACAAAAPVVGFGVWNLSHGWFFLPASIMMKQTVLPSVHESWTHAVIQGVIHLSAPPAFVALVLFAILLLVLISRAGGRLCEQPGLVVFLFAATLHLLLARFGYLYRYESYLMLLGVVGVGAALNDMPSGWTVVQRKGQVLGAAALAAVVTLLVGRVLESHTAVVTTAGHVFRQQRQIARFVGEHYEGERIAMNDIGAVSYYTQAEVLDLAGLASLPVARARRQDTFDASFINGWLDDADVRIAIVYDAWFRGRQRFVRSWIPVATWVTDEGGAEESTVNFYARDEEDARSLLARLEAFRRDMPPPIVMVLAGHVDARR